MNQIQLRLLNRLSAALHDLGCASVIGAFMQLAFNPVAVPVLGIALGTAGFAMVGTTFYIEYVIATADLNDD